jgi:hypothetical protein
MNEKGEKPLKAKARPQAGPGWYKLDNAARIYPAIRSKKWASVFRLSVVLREPVDPDVLQRALDITIKRFPSFAMRMKAGLFWHFFEPGSGRPLIEPDVSEPCVRMFSGAGENYLFRVCIMAGESHWRYFTPLPTVLAR